MRAASIRHRATGAKPYNIPKQLVWESAYQRAKANRAAAGVDGVSLAAFDGARDFSRLGADFDGWVGRGNVSASWAQSCGGLGIGAGVAEGTCLLCSKIFRFRFPFFPCILMRIKAPVTSGQ